MGSSIASLPDILVYGELKFFLKEPIDYFTSLYIAVYGLYRSEKHRSVLPKVNGD
jgi:hypothetical protein